MNAATWATAVIMVACCALVMTAAARARVGLRQRIRQRLGQSATAAAPPRPFWQGFALHLLFITVLVATVFATRNFTE